MHPTSSWQTIQKRYLTVLFHPSWDHIKWLVWLFLAWTFYLAPAEASRWSGGYRNCKGIFAVGRTTSAWRPSRSGSIVSTSGCDAGVPRSAFVVKRCSKEFTGEAGEASGTQNGQCHPADIQSPIILFQPGMSLPVHRLQDLLPLHSWQIAEFWQNRQLLSPSQTAHSPVPLHQLQSPFSH